MLGAEVTFDVALPKIIWGWLVSTNMWAKSIATGSFALGLIALRNYETNKTFFRFWTPTLALIFIAITLLVTILDLHHMFRFWHIFFYAHFTSAVTLGAWVVSGFVIAILLTAFAILTGREKLLDRLFVPSLVLAFFSTIYTAGIMGQATAREVWVFPAEMVAMLLSAVIAGSAIFLFLDGIFGGILNEKIKRDFNYLLMGSSALYGLMFVGEIMFAKMHSEFAEHVIKQLLTGEVAFYFWIGFALTFIVPIAMAGIANQTRKYQYSLYGAASALIGLWFIKHAWLLAPQTLPLS